MLSDTDRELRQNFYQDIFGKSRVNKRKVFTKSLWPTESYEIKIAELKKRGFENPQRLIRISPTILGYSLEKLTR